MGVRGDSSRCLQGQGGEEPGQSAEEPIDSKNYRCGACGATYSTESALRHHKVNKHIEVKETFLCALCGKGFMKKANMESQIPLHTMAKTKNEIARRQDQDIRDGPPPGGSQAAERQGESYRLPEQKIHPIAIKINLRDPYVIQNLENYGVKDREPTRQEAVQEGTDRMGSDKRGIRYEGNNNKGKYGARRGGDDQDAAGKKAAAGALATLPSASHKTCKTTIKAKEGNNSRPYELTDLKEETGLKSATGPQDPAHLCKKTAGAVRETKGIKGRSKGEDSLRAEIEKVDKEYRELL